MKPVLFILSLLTTLVNAQEVLFEKEIKLSRSLTENREAYPVKDATTGNVSIFLIDNTSIHGLLFDKDLKMIDELEGLRPEPNFPVLLGSNINNGDYNLFFSDKGHNVLAAATYNFATKVVKQTVINLSLKKERYIGSISHKNKFYILTTLKNTSSLKLYIFDNHYHFDTKTFDFPNEKFTSTNFSTLYYALWENETVYVDNEVPNPLDLTTSVSKLYCSDDKIVLSLDTRLSRTALITIDLQTLHASADFYKHGEIECDESIGISANSYIHHDQLYQFKVCNQGMLLSITNLKTKAVVNEFRIKPEEELWIKNTLVFQETGGSLSELSKTKQFLRKVASSNAGISVYKNKDKIVMLVGSYKEIQSSTGGRSSMGGAVGSLSYNPVFYGYNSYKFMRSIYFKSLLDAKTFDHQEGDVAQNVFDKIGSHTNQLDNKTTAETIFRLNESYILGHYLKNDKKYILKKFEN